MHRPSALALAALVLLSLSACGKAGRPLQPPGSVYPRIYPNPKATPATAEQKEGRALPPEWDQQDLKARFTPEGSYIDPSTQVAPSQTSPSLPNTTRSVGSDPFAQGLGGGGQAPTATAPTTDEEGQTQ